VSASLSKRGNRLNAEILTADYGYEKVVESSITSLSMNYAAGAWGNSYIIQLEDGSFFVQDGGATNGGDYEKLYRVLCDLHARATGKSVSASNPIRVAGWYLSHGHGDHYGNFVEMCRRHGSVILVDYLFANMPSDDETYNCYDPNLTIRNTMGDIVTMAKSGTTYVKVHAGQKFYLANLELEILYTHEDLYPINVEIFNDTTTTLRATVHHTDGSGKVDGSTSILFLGDLSSRGSTCMRAMYGDYLKADIVQVAHHGYNGCDYSLYAAAAPSILLWPNSVAAFISQTDTPNAVWYEEIDYQIANTMQSVEYIVMMDIYNTCITLTKDGPDMSLGGEAGLKHVGKDACDIPNYGTAVVKK
jgi:hypothetical protein